MRGCLCALRGPRSPKPHARIRWALQEGGVPLGLETQVAGGFVESELERSSSSGGGGATMSRRTPALALLAVS